MTTWADGTTVARAASYLEARLLSFALASNYGIAPGNTAAANKAGFDAAMTALAAGGTLLCDWTGTVSVATTTAPTNSIQPPDGVRIMGRGRATKIKMSNPASGTGSMVMFYPVDGATFTIEKLTLEGPTTLLGAADFVGGVQHDGTSGGIRVIDCALQKFTYGLRRNPSAVSTVFMDVIDTDIVGYNGTYDSHGILWSTAATGAANGAYLRMRGGSITQTGSSAATGGDHGIYVTCDAILDIDGVIFSCNALAGDFGYAIKISDVSVVTANVSKAVVRGCLFKDGASALSRGVLTGTTAGYITALDDCTFQNRGIALEVAGAAVICNNTVFTGFTQANNLLNISTANGTATFLNCRFACKGSGIISVGATGVNVTFLGCEFVQDVLQGSILGFAAGSDQTSQIVARACRFSGSAAGQTTIYHGAAGVMILEFCQFVQVTSGGGIVIYVPTNGTSKTMRIHRCDFSQSGGGGSYFADSTNPATFDVSQNYGSTGYKTENGGISTTTPGAVATVSIAHGLVLTPTKFDATPANANARNAVTAPVGGANLSLAYYVTADATNVIINLSGNLAAATSYAWNWRAEYQ